jgi:hypothetical protein
MRSLFSLVLGGSPRFLSFLPLLRGSTSLQESLFLFGASGFGFAAKLRVLLPDMLAQYGCRRHSGCIRQRHEHFMLLVGQYQFELAVSCHDEFNGTTMVPFVVHESSGYRKTRHHRETNEPVERPKWR